MSPRIHDLQSLLVVSETLSMTEAARRLGVTTASVSATVQRVETQSQTRIFERTTRSMRVTPEGQRLLQAARNIVGEWRQLTEPAEGPGVALSGEVHVAAPADATYSFLAPGFLALLQDEPLLDVVFHPSDAIHHLLEERVDVALRYGALPPSSLVARRVAALPRILVASPEWIAAHPDHDDLGAHRMLILRLGGRAESTWHLQTPDGSRSIEAREAWQGDGHLVRRWALDGHGVALKSALDVIDDLEAGNLVQVQPSWQTLDTPIHVVFPERRWLPARVRVVIEHLASLVQARAQRWADLTTTGAVSALRSSAP